jgi:hypothetical protein
MLPSTIDSGGMKIKEKEKQRQSPTVAPIVRSGRRKQ